MIDEDFKGKTSLVTVAARASANPLPKKLLNMEFDEDDKPAEDAKKLL